MATSRFRPIASFYRAPKAAHPTFVKEVLSDEFLSQSTVAPGKRDNTLWMTLRPEDTINDAGSPGQLSTYSTYRPPVIIMNYSNVWKPTYVGKDWTYVPSPQEKQWRALSLATYQDELEQLEQIHDPSDDDKEKMKAIRDIIAQLQTGGPGYLETSYNCLGTGVSGIAWKLGAANVPVTVTTLFKTQRNRPQSFRFKRLELPEGQARGNWTMELGNGVSLYSLVISEDGNSAEFFHYRNMSEADRKILIDQLNIILDKQRLTVQDQTQILAWEKEIRKIRYDAKQSGQKVDGVGNDRIDYLRKQIDELKDSKRSLSDEDQDKKSDIEKALYIEHEQFSLQEQSKKGIGTVIDFTWHFLRSGYVVIQTNDGRKIYENKRLTGGVPEGAEPQFGNGLPAGAFITIKSDGGMWALVYGNPRFDSRAMIWDTPFDIPFEFDESEINWIAEKDEFNPGCKIIFTLKKIKNRTTIGATTVSAKYQIQVEMRSDFEITDDSLKGRYTPELYYVELRIPAPSVLSPSPEDYLWKSEDTENKWSVINKNKIVDLSIQDDASRCRACTLTIADGTDSSNLPLLLGGSACDIDLYDTVNGTTISVCKSGFTGQRKPSAIKDVYTMGDEIRVINSYGNQVEAIIGGCENFLDKEILASVTGNNMYVGDYIRLMCVDAELQASLYSSLPVGNSDGCPKIPRMKPGAFPDCKPSPGTRYWEWFCDVVSKHAPGWEIWTDSAGIRLTRKNQRLRTDLQYTTSGDPMSDKRLRKMSTQSGGLVLFQDLRDYYTSATIIGGINPLTGMRYVGYAVIPQATDPRFKDSMFYTGVANHYTASPDDSLKSQAACDKAANEFLNITPLTPQGMPPWYLESKAELDTTLKAGDIPTVNGIKFILENVDFAAINSGNEDGQQMHCLSRLAEDKKVNPDA